MRNVTAGYERLAFLCREKTPFARRQIAVERESSLSFRVRSGLGETEEVRDNAFLPSDEKSPFFVDCAAIKTSSLRQVIKGRRSC